MIILSVLPRSDDIANLYATHPGLHHPGDAGIDLLIPNDIIVPAHARGFTLDHGISCCLRLIYEHTQLPPILRSYYLYSRSSISKTPLRMCNSVGIIDSGYRGNILAMVDNVSDVPYEIKRGTRLFQICAPTLEPLQLELVTALPTSERWEQSSPALMGTTVPERRKERGEHGVGSTGV